MRYYLEEIENQIIDALRGDSELSGVQVKTHAGEVNVTTLTTSGLLESFVQEAPFIYIQYQGKKKILPDSTRGTVAHELTFCFFVGHRALHARNMQTGCYQLLRKVYDNIQGKWLNGTYNLASNLERLNGLTIISASNASPIVLEITDHQYSSGDKVFIRGGLGNTAINNDSTNEYWTVTKIDANTISLDNSVGNGVYTSGGLICSAMTQAFVLSPFDGLPGQDEKLQANIPEIKVYSTLYSVRLLA